MRITNAKVIYTFNGEEKTVDMGNTTIVFHNDMNYLGTDDKGCVEHRSGVKSVVIGDNANRWKFDESKPPQQSMSNSVRNRFQDLEVVVGSNSIMVKALVDSLPTKYKQAYFDYLMINQSKPDSKKQY